MTARDRLAPVAEGEVLAGKYRVERSSASAGWASSSRRTHLAARRARRDQVPPARRARGAERRRRASCARRARPSRSRASTSPRVHRRRHARQRRARTWSWSTSTGTDLARVARSSAGRSPSTTRSTTCSRPARRSPRRTRSASSTATSSRRTSSSPRAPTARRCIKVLDFGISKVAGADAVEGMALTRTTAVMGSPLLHVARADALDAERRRAHRHLVARRHPLRAPHQTLPFKATTRFSSS